MIIKTIFEGGKKIILELDGVEKMSSWQQAAQRSSE